MFTDVSVCEARVCTVLLKIQRLSLSGFLANDMELGRLNFSSLISAAVLP